MDWADDIAHSVHDVEDFFRAGQIPLDRLYMNSSNERDKFLEAALDRLEVTDPAERGQYKHHAQRVFWASLFTALTPGRYLCGVQLATRDA